MAKIRRFKADSLTGLDIGAQFQLSPEESHHARVLRLEPGTTIEVADAAGQCVRAVIEDSAAPAALQARLVERMESLGPQRIKLRLAVAWPKGKRAALMVEKCAELGVDELIPIRYERSVVVKNDESEGVFRLRRIAAEASKQCGRRTEMIISPEIGFFDLLTQPESAELTLLLDPNAREGLALKVQSRPKSVRNITLLIGPEGGVSEREIVLAEQHGVDKVHMAAHVLRIETAALAASAICRSVLLEETVSAVSQR